MGNGKGGRLLRKSKWEFPDENDSGVYENRKRSVLKFAGEITADPGIWAEQRQMTFRPTPGDVGKHRQHRQFVIVIPKEEGIVPEKEETERYNDQTCGCRS